MHQNSFSGFFLVGFSSNWTAVPVLIFFPHASLVGYLILLGVLSPCLRE